MCVPSVQDGQASGILGGVLKGASAITNGLGVISDYKAQKNNYAYRTQIAINNAKVAQNEALRQKQLGIEKARMEKISGLQDVDRLKAQNSASGFDLMSQTNQLNYQDMYNLSDSNANLVKKEYDLNSRNYLAQANGYFNQANEYKKQYNKSIFDYSLNALGKMNKVATDWYENYQENNNVVF